MKTRWDYIKKEAFDEVGEDKENRYIIAEALENSSGYRMK